VGAGQEDISWYDFLDHDPTEEDVAEERQRQKEWEGHFGTELEILGEWLADKYPWENVGDAVVFLISGRPDKIRGGDENDQQYGGRGNDVIYSEGGFRDLVNGGRGTDTCYVDPKDRVKGCERKR
jgi:hypothetical protein